jgi:hypothetical protein
MRLDDFFTNPFAGTQKISNSEDRIPREGGFGISKAFGWCYIGYRNY